MAEHGGGIADDGGHLRKGYLRAVGNVSATAVVGIHPVLPVGAGLGGEHDGTIEE